MKQKLLCFYRCFLIKFHCINFTQWTWNLNKKEKENKIDWKFSHERQTIKTTRKLPFSPLKQIKSLKLKISSDKRENHQSIITGRNSTCWKLTLHVTWKAPCALENHHQWLNLSMNDAVIINIFVKFTMFSFMKICFISFALTSHSFGCNYDEFVGISLNLFKKKLNFCDKKFFKIISRKKRWNFCKKIKL